MKILIAIACLVILASAQSLSGNNAQFESFKRQFGKSYKSAVEEEFRLKIFLNNLKIIADHNKLHQGGKVTFDLGINQFADLTNQEFAAKQNGYRQPANYKPKNVYTDQGDSAPPASIDWRDYGYVTAVKDEGQCPVSYAFSATGSLEGQHFNATGNLVSLSEQNIMDCTWDYGNQGCNGGMWTGTAFDYIIDNNGIDTEASYPYMERDGVCKYTLANRGATASGYTDVRSGDETALTIACGNNGPISVTIDASHASFQLYSSGVYYEPACFENILDHSVLVAGYGTEGGQDYYLVKNSWGRSWGEEGYIKMSRNRSNNCGIATQALWPQI